MIRKANLDSDLDSLYELNKVISPDETKERFLEELEKVRGKVFLFEKDEQCIGFISFIFPFWNNISIILHFAVADNFRGQGIGTQLLDFVKCEAKELGSRFISVDTALWNYKAIKLYEKVGFTPRAVLPNYFGPKNDMVWLDCDLRNSENE